MMDLQSFFQTGATTAGGYAPGAMVVATAFVGSRVGLIPPVVTNVVATLPLVAWGAGAGYAFNPSGDSGSTAALKGAAGSIGAVMALGMMGFE